MLYTAYLDPSVVAFNTRGNFKHTITRLIHLPGSPQEGIFIKKRYLTSLSSSLVPIRPRVHHTLNTFFDKIFVINVASNVERWNRIVAMMQTHNITNYERIDAVTPATSAKYGWKWPTAHKFREDITHSSMGVQLAIKLSNWLCMCIAKERNYNRFLILEDDAKLVQGSLDKFPQVCASLEQSCPDWDMFYLFAKFHKVHRQIDDNISKLDGACTTTAYALSRRRLDYIIEQVALNQSQPVDDILCNMVAPNVNVYMSTPMIFEPDASLVSHVPYNKTEPKTRRVKMLCSWQDPLSLCHEMSNMCQYDFRYNYLEFTHEDHNIDYYVLINRPRPIDHYEPAKTIVMTMEPWNHIPGTGWGVHTWGEWARPDPAKFLEVFSHDRHLNAG
jgi:GR25 family glycosyltransferase involved in LPS biosynthesis